MLLYNNMHTIYQPHQKRYLQYQLMQQHRLKNDPYKFQEVIVNGGMMRILLYIYKVYLYHQIPMIHRTHP